MAAKPRKSMNGKTNGAPGRPSKNTPENKEKIVQAITIGCTFQLAAQTVGISVPTLTRWRQDDEDFDQAILEAAGACERSLVAIIQTAARGTPARPAIPARAGQPSQVAVAAVQGDWRAAAFILERKWPANWGRRFKIDGSVTHDGSIQHEVTQAAPSYEHMSMDQQVQLFELLTLAESGAVGGPDDGA